jgi:hypothetical protein
MDEMMKRKYTLKQILLSNQNWLRFYEKYKATLRIGIIVAVVKLLSCRNRVRGYHEYHCSNSSCTHVKSVSHTCKGKACSSCGKKATEIWIEKQNNILPHTPWQHITFTMPCELWDFFWYNRSLLNQVSPLAVHCIQSFAKEKKLILGIFTALHTFSRNLKRNVHLHASTTTGGLFEDGSRWQKLFFKQNALMKIWRYQIIHLFRQAYQNHSLILPPSIQKQLNPTFTFNHFLNYLYQKTWVVHCSKPSTDHKKNVAYLARYIKRPAIAESKLRHYDGQSVVFNYRDHKTNTYQQCELTIEEFIARFVQHIPDVGFRMIRYYGFLSHRLRKKLLPIVYQLLGQPQNRSLIPSTYAELIQKNFHFKPLVCILCGQPLLLVAIHLGKTAVHQLLKLHRSLALLQTP